MEEKQSKRGSTVLILGTRNVECMCDCGDRKIFSTSVNAKRVRKKHFQNEPDESLETY